MAIESDKALRVAIYYRISTEDQILDSQQVTLREYVKQRGFILTEEYSDVGWSGSKSKRPSLDRLMSDAFKRKFDVVLVFRFDRFARSTKHLALALETFRGLGVDFISYSESIDTSTPMGAAMFTIISAMAQLERDITIERVHAGLKAARSRGKILGRPKTANDSSIRAMLNANKKPSEISETLGVGMSAIYRVKNNNTKAEPLKDSK
jgi:DNA invertase Pin-like site-specific DNA recombinase